MIEGHRRGVTRGYVGGLIFAVAIVALALLLLGWAGLALLTGGGPVTTPGTPLWTAPLIVLAALGLLAWGLWLQSLALLRGLRTPPWGHTIALAGAGYLLWCLGAVLAGLRIEESWLSPYAAVLAAVWALASLLCWAVLARRVYTDRPVPQWPWEKRGEPGPDWIGGDNPWTGPPGEGLDGQGDGFGDEGPRRDPRDDSDSGGGEDRR